MSIQPYLFFNGRCEEAIAFYGEAIGASVIMKMRFDENPQPQPAPAPAAALPEGWGAKVMHCALRIGESTVLASDGMCADANRFEGFSLSLNATDAAQAERWFAALSAGGQVRMPLGRTFWSSCFGMLSDRFGVGWMIGVNAEPATDAAAAATQPADDSRELVLERVIAASPDKLYRAWTEPELLKQWFTPRPWTTPVIENDVRPGGSSLIVMRGPDGQEFPNRGVYLDAVKNERLVFTDAFVTAWEPSPKPFMTGTITFEDLGAGRTRYLARVTHWSAADREAHERMGFHEGWGKATDQLEALVATL